MNSEDDLACKTICRPHNSIQSAGAAVGSEAMFWSLMWIHYLLLLLLFEAPLCFGPVLLYTCSSLYRSTFKLKFAIISLVKRELVASL